MEKSVREILYDALRDLTEEQFKAFKWTLRGYNEGHGTIPWGELEKADRRDVVDLLYGCYGDDNSCISVLRHVLVRINARSVAMRVLDLTPTPRATAEDYRLVYMDYIKVTFTTMRDHNSLLGEDVPLKDRYSKLIILDHHRPEKEREHEIMTSGSQHDQVMKNRDSCSISIQTLFQPDGSGLIPDIVVLQGAAGIGKTMTARKILLDWACGELYPDLFDYVFYIHCRGMNLGTEEKSLADIILTQGAEKDAIKGMLKNPQKLLFIVDGFDELRFSIDQPEDCLCSDPWKKASMSVLLSSLFRKKLLPKSRLVITTRPTALEKLRLLLGRSRYAEILGFSPEDRREYFHRFFQNKDQAEKALQVVQLNETLFTMCFVPIICWIICTVMKQQLDRGEDLLQTSNTVTAVYMLYLSSLFKPPKSHGKGRLRTNLRGLCSLAADGIRKREILFWEEEIQKYGLDQEDSLPLFLNENIFKRDIECICAYSFIHLSFQEFFAALSYVLEEGEGDLHIEKPNRDVETLLESYRTSRRDLALTVRFLFGLLNEEKRMKDLKEKFGWKISPKVKDLLLQWVKNTTETKISSRSSIPELFGLLYEIQEVDFVKSSLDPVTEVQLYTSFTDMDIVILTFCLKNCHNLEVLNLRQLTFSRKEREPVPHFCESAMYRSSKLREIRLSACNLTAGCCKGLSPVLITHQTLVNLDVSRNNLEDSGVKLLCEALRHPGCKLQSLKLGCCSITGASCGDLSSVLSTNQNLKELDLHTNELTDSGLKFLCEGLKHPNCRLKSIIFENCQLTTACCEDLSSVLCSNQYLGELVLSYNSLGNAGMKLLCGALEHPNCQLQKLWLSWCELSEASWVDLSSVLSTNQNLRDLRLNGNNVGTSGVRHLSEGLNHPNCRLQKLSLSMCNLMGGACCRNLASLLSTSQSLTHLNLDDIKIMGGRQVRLLREGLEHPNCKLRNLSICTLTASEEIRQELGAVKNAKPDLNIEYL